MKREIVHIVIGTDANYLHKAVIYYESLYRVYKEFILHVFCFDELTHDIFSQLKYKNVELYHPFQFETKELIELKASKERLYEYYWAVNAFITKFVMDKHKPKTVTFSDCDIMFFSSPETIFKEIKRADVLIQPNNFSFQSVKDFIPVGYYCSSFECFRNNVNGKKILNWWHNQCMKWCLAKFEDGRFGDQKYLDGWRIRFKGVREVVNPGANIAPWNVQKYDLIRDKGKVLLNGKWPVIYYHYHSFKMNLNTYRYAITGDRNNVYDISSSAIELVYKPYIKQMIKVIKKLKKIKKYEDYTRINPEGSYHTQK